MSTFNRDPETGVTTVSLTTDDHGRIRDTNGPRPAVGDLEQALAHLDDAIHGIAQYVEWTRTHRQHTYSDMSANFVPENTLNALLRVGEATRVVEALNLYLEAQAEQDATEEVQA